MGASGRVGRTGSVPVTGNSRRDSSMADIGAPELLEGEKLIWSGRPQQGWRLGPKDGLAIVQGPLVTAFAVFWEICVLQNGWSIGTVVFGLFGAPFVLLGLYMLVGRYPVDAWLRRRTSYALTSSRIVISRSPPFGRVSTIFIDSVPEFELIEEGHGRGTIRCGRRVIESETTVFGVTRYETTTVSPAWDWAFSSMTPSLDSVPQLIGIENAGEVFHQIQRAVACALQSKL